MTVFFFFADKVLGTIPKGNLMAKYIVKNIQCGLTASGLSADTVNVEIELQEESGKSFFISEVEFESFPNIYRTSESVFTKLMNEGSDSEEAAEKLTVQQRHEKGDEFFAYLNGTCALYNSDGYTEFYENAGSYGGLYDALRLLIYITRADWDEINRCKSEYIGKTIGEFEIPKCDAERAVEMGLEIWQLEDDE